jgi:hypothetical protein
MWLKVKKGSLTVQKLYRLHSIKHLTVAALYGCHVQLMAT